MSALIADLGDERVTPQRSNAMVNATGKLLKSVEMSYKYGAPRPDGSRDLALIDDAD